MLRLLSRGRKVSTKLRLCMPSTGSLPLRCTGGTLPDVVYCPRPCASLAALQAQEGGEEEPKNYKKANLGQANQMYYNDEVGGTQQ